MKRKHGVSFDSERFGFISHLTIFLLVNFSLWWRWLDSPGFPWMLFITAPWAFGLWVHSLEMRGQETDDDERIGFIGHLLTFMLVNFGLWWRWLDSPGFPWPLFVMATWALGLWAHFWSLGRADEELDDGAAVWHDDAAVEQKSKRLADTGMRLTDDGELIDEAEYLRQQETR